MAFIVVYAGLSVTEYKNLTLREYVAIRSATEEKLTHGN
jgi:hypothetical protein